MSFDRFDDKKSNSNHSMINHSSLHDSMHKKDFHSSIHDHKKIHESMHIGKDKIINPHNHGNKY